MTPTLTLGTPVRYRNSYLIRYGTLQTRYQQGWIQSTYGVEDTKAYVVQWHNGTNSWVHEDYLETLPGATD